MSWIKIIPYEKAEGKLKKLYNRVKGPDNNVDNILSAHSLRPHSLEGHMVLYKNVLHHSNNTIPKWFLETIGVYVSMLNHCDYCVEHHFSGLKRLLDDAERRAAIRAGLEKNDYENLFDQRQILALDYARKLTESPGNMSEQDATQLKASGWSDGELLEINQVTAYFNYANRTVLGLGVTTDGDILGLSPNDNSDPDNWSHQ
ncbi:MAG: alkylhydroperoxidase [Bacteroidetes bacterium]|nr:MAG: alkylhydroperoxidase [Bacteroidota bacterium]